MSLEPTAELTVFSSAARTVTAASVIMENYASRGVKLHLDITAVSGTAPTLDVRAQSYVPLGNTFVDISNANFVQKTATGTDSLTIYPGIAETANDTVNDVIPRRWRVLAVIGGTGPSFTFSLSAEMLA